MPVEPDLVDFTPGLLPRLEARDYVTMTAESADEVRQAPPLRYDVFCQEFLRHTNARQLGCNGFDSICDHLLVRKAGTGQVVGTCRLDSSGDADYYSRQEFEMSAILRLPGEKAVRMLARRRRRLREAGICRGFSSLGLFHAARCRGDFSLREQALPHPRSWLVRECEGTYERVKLVLCGAEQLAHGAFAAQAFRPASRGAGLKVGAMSREQVCSIGGSNPLPEERIKPKGRNNHVSSKCP